MKKLLFGVVLISLTSLVFGQEKGIRFEQSLNWKQLKAKAKAENKFIFLDAFATWCIPCKFMDDSVYTSEKAGAFINRKFVSVKVQMDSSNKDNEQIKNLREDIAKLQSEYKISAYPSLLFFNPQGQLVHKFVGAMRDTTFISVAADALNPQKQYYTLLNKFNKDKLQYAEMPRLAKSARQLNETAEANKISEKYISYLLKQDESKLFTKENLELIRDFMGDTDSRSFKFFMEQKDKVNAVLGKNIAEYAIRSAISKQFIPKEDKWVKAKPDWDLLEQKITAKFGALGQEMVQGKRMIYYSNIRDWENYGKYYELYFEKALQRPEYIVNNMSWILFLNVNDPKVLAFACDTVMKYAMEEWYQNDAQAYDTYANLLYKTGKTSKGIEWEEKAVKLSNNEKSMVETLDKMKNNQPTSIMD